MPLVGHFNRTIVSITSLLNDSCTEGWGNPQRLITRGYSDGQAQPTQFLSLSKSQHYL
jgi:hypothetical protein